MSLIAESSESSNNLPTASTNAPPQLNEPSASKADALLAQAQDDLRITEEAEQQVRKRLKELTAHPHSNPELIKEYAEYLQRLEALSAAHRSKLADLESVYTRHTNPNVEEKALPPLVLDDDEKWQAPHQAKIEEGSLESLEAEFNKSLNTFDGFLLHEQDMLSTEMSHIASQAKSAIDALTAHAKETAEDLKKKGEQPPPASKETAETKDSSSETETKPPTERRGDPSSDDVVARQLREAAESETDPALKEKLWVEYDDYKEGISE